MAIGTNLMEALTTSLADFRGRVEADSGHRIAVLGHASGIVIDLCRQVLGAVADAFAWLAEALGSIADFLRVADALVALVEVAGAAFTGLTEIMALGGLARHLSLPAGPFDAVDAAFATARDAVDKGTQIVGHVPRSDDIENVRAELGKLLGRRVNPELQHDGALGRLLAAIAPA